MDPLIVVGLLAASVVCFGLCQINVGADPAAEHGDHHVAPAHAHEAGADEADVHAASH